jgi:hypothetical protein
MLKNSSSDLCAGVTAPTHLSIFTTTVSVCLALVTIPGNLLVCYAILKDPFRELRTPFSFLILCLAMTDLLVGILMDPVSVIFHLSEALKINLVDIRILHILYFILSTASILSLGALTFDRYVAVIYPLKYKNYLSSKRSIIASVVIWLVSLGLSSVYFKLGYIFYSLIFANTAVFLTFLVLLFVYISIYKRLHAQVNVLSHRRATDTRVNRINKKKLSNLKWETKVTKALVLVLLAYILCFAPACIIIYVLNFCSKCDCEFIHWLRDLQFVIVLLNSAINPYLYAWRMPQFKKVLFKFCSCITRSRKIDTSEVVTPSKMDNLGSNLRLEQQSQQSQQSQVSKENSQNITDIVI